MYKIKDLEFIDLNSAMDYEKSLNEFVSIKGNGFEVCGMFGVDSVKDGKCPDGVKYDWDKSARIGRVKKNEVN
jgi:hypothetical protein